VVPNDVIEQESTTVVETDVIEQESTTVVKETATVVEGVHDNVMQQREVPQDLPHDNAMQLREVVPQDSAGQKGSAIEHAHNGGSQETPVVVKEAPKISYASMLKNNAAQPTVALKKPPPVRTGASVQKAVQASRILVQGREVFVRDKEARANKSLSSTPSNIAEGTGCSVFINNLPGNITLSQVEEEMKKFGAIKPSGVQVRSREGGVSSYAFVEFKVAASAEMAIETSPIVINGRRVYIDEKKTTRRQK
jgi:hypothetical protein